MTEEEMGHEAVETKNPFFAAPKKLKWLTLIGIYVSIIGMIIQSSTLSTLLPVAAAEIGGLEYYSMVSTLSSVSSVVIMPLWGYLGAKNPALKRPLFCVSILVGAVVVFLRSISPDMMTIVIPSIMYGFVSSGIFVLGYSIIRDMFDAKAAGMYLGFCGTMTGVGMLVGPLVGGIIMDMAGWRWVCTFIWPFFVISALLVWFGVRVTKAQAAPMASVGGSFDMSGTIAMAVFLGGVLVALSLGTTFLPFGTIGNNLVWVVSVIALIVLIFVMRKKKDDAIIPTSALTDRNTLCFVAANFFNNFSNMAIFFFLPMYAITVMGSSATEASLLTTVYSFIGLFMGPIFGRMIGKARNARGVLTFGCVVRIIVALAILLVISPTTSMFILYVIMFFAGFYNSVQSTAFSAGPQVQLPERIRVQGNSVIQVSQNFGGAIGTAVFTVILNSMGVLDGMPAALMVAIACAVCALVAALLLKKLDPESPLDE